MFFFVPCYSSSSSASAARIKASENRSKSRVFESSTLRGSHMEQLHLRLIHKGVILRGSNGIRNDVFDLAHADSLREGNEKTALPVPLTITMAGLGASQRPTGEQCRLSPQRV